MEETKEVDWDAELKKLNEENDGDVIRSLGMDGEEVRKERKKWKIIKDSTKSSFKEGTPDAKWVSGFFWGVSRVSIIIVAGAKY